MTQSQYNTFSSRRYIPGQGRNLWLQRHPVLVPLLFLSGAALLAIASLFADTLFPVLVFLGISPTLVCLSLTFVLGISGIVASIIGIIEFAGRYSLPTALFAKPKEQSYANRN